MPKLHSHHDFSASRDTVWPYLLDFGNIQRWWPVGYAVNIERVEVEGAGVGMVRHIYNTGFDTPVSERLDYLDADNYTYKLSIVGSKPAGLILYQAKGTLQPLDNGGCRLNYDSEFTTQPGSEDEAREFLLLAYNLMYDGLDQTCAQSN